MAAPAAVLSVLVKANTGAAINNLRKVDKQVTRTGRSSDRTSGKFTALSRVGKRNFGFLATGAKATGVALGAGMFVGAKKAAGAATDLGEQINKTRVVFRGSEKDILNWSKSTATSLGISRREALSAASTFGNLLVPMGVARKEAGQMSKRFVTLAADLASFNNASPEEALEALRSGLSGETEPLRKFGVFLSETRVKAEAMRQGFKLTNGQLSESAKAQARYALVLKDSRDAQGDFARTSGSFANQQRIIKAQLDNLAASVGRLLLPALTSGARALSGFLKDMERGKGTAGDIRAAFQSVVDVLKDPNLTAGEKFNKIGDMIGQGIAKATPVVADAARKVAGVAVRGFFDAFRASPLWVKLLTAGFILKKLGGFSAFRTAGTQAGGQMAEGMATSGKWAGLRGQMRGIGKAVIGGALIAGAADAITREGIKGIGDRWQQFASTASFGLIPGPRDIDQRLQTISSRIQAWRNSGQLALNRPGDPTNSLIREKDLDDFDANSKRMLTKLANLRNVANRVIGPGSKLNTGAWANPGPAIRDFKAIEVGMNRLKNRLAGDSAGIAQVSGRNLRLMAKHMNLHSREGQQAVSRNMRATLTAIQDRLGSGEISAKAALKGIRNAFKIHTGASKETAARNFAAARGSIQGAMAAGTISARDGLREIQRLFKQYLGAFGIKGRDAEVYLKGGDNKGGNPANRPLNFRQRGGPIFGGKSSGDSVPAMLERGEYVLNRKAVQAIGARNLNALNFSTAPRFQKGGQIPRQIVGGPGFGGVQPSVQKGLDMNVKAANALLREAKAKKAQEASGPKGKPTGVKGVVSYPGLQFGIAKWVLGALNHARRKGFSGQPTSGYRPHWWNVSQGRNYRSEHEGTQYPHGAIDFGGFTTGLATKNAFVAATSDYKHPLLAPIGFRDDGHASGTGHQRGGLIGRLVGMQRGGQVQPMEKEAFKDLYKRLWKVQAPLMGGTGKGRPKLGFGGIGGEGYYWPSSNTIAFDPKILSRLGPGANIGEKWWSLGTLVHEFAHARQDRNLFDPANRKALEGGAEWFTQARGQRVLRRVGETWVPGQRAYPAEVRWAKKNRSRDWMLRKQFRGDRGPLKGNVKGAPAPFEFDATTRSLGGTIRNTGRKVGAHRRFILAALTAAMTETGGPGRKTGIIRNPWGGDATSVGMFQMTDDKGSAAQRHDPVFASKWFYRTAKQLSSPGRSLATIAQDVERSGYPGRYAQYADDAGRLASELARSTRAGGGGTPAAGPMSKRNRRIFKRIPKRLKKIKGIGLSKKQEGWLKHLHNLNATYGEYASRAQGLNVTEGETETRGKVGGKDEAYWLSRQLLTLWQLRETLIKYHEVIVKKRERTTEMIEKAQKFLKKLQKDPKRNRKLIDAYKKRVIPALKKARSGLGTRRGEILTDLGEIQGSHGSPMTSLVWKKPYGTQLGTLGGTIFEVQKSLRDLNAPAAKTPPSTPDTSARADILAELLRESRLRYAVAQNELKNLPFAGSFDRGGVVPGPIGKPAAAIVHGGEVIGQPGDVSVTVNVAPGMEWLKQFISVEVDKSTRTQSRRASRGLPGGRGA